MGDKQEQSSFIPIIFGYITVEREVRICPEHHLKADLEEEFEGSETVQ